MAPRTDLVNALDVAHYLRVTYDVEVQPATIRKWASRGRIGSHSMHRDARGRYDIREVIAYARELGIIPPARS
jgi:hypothetical protein